MERRCSMGNTLLWRVNAPQLLKEVLNNPGTSMLAKPVQIFGLILSEVGVRAAELNDPRLNALMCRLAIYSIADGFSPDKNFELVNEVIKNGYSDGVDMEEVKVGSGDLDDVEPSEFDFVLQAAREYLVFLLSDWKSNIEEYETVRADFLQRFNSGVKAQYDSNKKGVNRG